jgi:hypothetical protein
MMSRLDSDSIKNRNLGVTEAIGHDIGTKDSAELSACKQWIAVSAVPLRPRVSIRRQETTEGLLHKWIVTTGVYYLVDTFATEEAWREPTYYMPFRIRRVVLVIIAEVSRQYLTQIA